MNYKNMQRPDKTGIKKLEIDDRGWYRTKTAEVKCLKNKKTDENGNIRERTTEKEQEDEGILTPEKTEYVTSS